MVNINFWGEWEYCVIPGRGIVKPNITIASQSFIFRFLSSLKYLLGLLKTKNKIPQKSGMVIFGLRREWDSNPRYPFGVHTLSKRAP